VIKTSGDRREYRLPTATYGIATISGGTSRNPLYGKYVLSGRTWANADCTVDRFPIGLLVIINNTKTSDMGTAALLHIHVGIS
jgi:hypothetical protein